MTTDDLFTAKPRRPSPLGGRKPSREDLDRVATDPSAGVDDVLPASNSQLRLLIVGINPGLWTAAVNAPFAHPGNRFWPSLFKAGLTDSLLDVSRGLTRDAEIQFLKRGIGLTNLVPRATAKASELSRTELQEGGKHLIAMAKKLRPRVIAIAGITAFRTAFSLPKATMGKQNPKDIPDWPIDVALWVVPQPSGLNAHENVDSLAIQWREVWGSIPTD